MTNRFSILTQINEEETIPIIKIIPNEPKEIPSKEIDKSKEIIKTVNDIFIFEEMGKTKKPKKNPKVDSIPEEYRTPYCERCSLKCEVELFTYEQKDLWKRINSRRRSLISYFALCGKCVNYYDEERNRVKIPARLLQIYQKLFGKCVSCSQEYRLVTSRLCGINRKNLSIVLDNDIKSPNHFPKFGFCPDCGFVEIQTLLKRLYDKKKQLENELSYIEITNVNEIQVLNCQKISKDEYIKTEFIPLTNEIIKISDFIKIPCQHIINNFNSFLTFSYVIGWGSTTLMDDF